MLRMRAVRHEPPFFYGVEPHIPASISPNNAFFAILFDKQK